MERWSKSYINSLVRDGYAKEIDEKNYKTIMEHGYTKVAYASGLYGICAGVLVDDKTGEEYAITQRESMLFRFF